MRLMELEGQMRKEGTYEALVAAAAAELPGGPTADAPYEGRPRPRRPPPPSRKPAAKRQRRQASCAACKRQAAEGEGAGQLLYCENCPLAYHAVGDYFLPSLCLVNDEFTRCDMRIDRPPGLRWGGG